LSGAAFDPPLPRPILEFDSGPVASAQQRKLSMRLAAPSPLTTSGSVRLTFRPDATLLTDDPAVVFLATGTRTLPFAVKEGDTQIRIAGQTSAVFQTGTTSGQLRFELFGVAQEIDGDPTVVLTVPPARVSLDLATATRRAGALDIQMIGFDNTYTMGNMSFTFFDTSGLAIGPVRADFTGNFGAYFTKTKAGSAFQALVSFGVSGDASTIAGVDVDLTNAAGTFTTQRLVFR
jgi:hypothetical protein